MHFENTLKERLNILEEQRDRLRDYIAKLPEFLGPGQTSDEINSIYNLEELKESNQFIYLLHAIQSMLRSHRNHYKRLVEHLEDFLAVLEEYE